MRQRQRATLQADYEQFIRTRPVKVAPGFPSIPKPLPPKKDAPAPEPIRQPYDTVSILAT